MGPEIVNRIKDSEIHGDLVERDKITNIILYQDNERKFVVTHNANIRPVSYFTGRETELRDLRQRIESGRKSVLVSGMGGIGKTHICRKLFEEYLNKHAENGNGPFHHIGYIEYNGDMGSSLWSCLKYKEQESQEANQEAAWRELEYLASDGKLLLFVDNVDKPMADDPGLQRLKSIPGAVVLTSRQTSFSDEFEPYQIGFLEIQQCREIYERIRFEDSGGTVKQEEISDLEYIIEKLAGRHTITIELLAHMARTKLWPVKKLRKELDGRGFRLEFHKNGELINIQKSYEALYDLSKLTEAEQNILEAFSIFPYIPLSAETCNQWLLEDAGVSEDDDILIGLYQKGWLQFDMKQESYALHPVFAQFIYEKCKPKWKKHSSLIDECQRSIRIPENGSILMCQEYIPFSENIAEKVVDMEQFGLIDALANLFDYMGEIEKSEKLYRKLLKIHNNLVKKECLETARLYYNLAVSYSVREEYKRAEELSKKSLRIYERELGENHPATAEIYCGLATVYLAQEEYKKAQGLFEKSLGIYEKVLGVNHPETAEGYMWLAELYLYQGRDNKAEELFKKSLSIYEKVLGVNHPKTAIVYNDMAAVYDNRGDYNRALDYLIKAYKIFVFSLGLNSWKTQNAYENIERMYIICKLEGNFEQWLEEKMKE